MYNIVIADDEQLERIVLRQSLEEYLSGRCYVRAATNGREAVEAALQTEADIVFMDIEMPGMKGLEAARIILGALPDCKIIMLTAYGEFEYAREAISIGSVDYLLKPCPDGELYRALDRVLPQIDRRLETEAEKARSIERIRKLSSQIEEQVVLAIMGGDVNPGYIQEQMRTYGVDFHNGAFAILCGGKNAASALKSSPWPENIHPFLYGYDDKIYIVSVSSSGDVDSFDATAAQLLMLSQAAETLWGHPLIGAVGRRFSNLKYAQLSCFEAYAALGKCSPGRPVYACVWDGGQAESSDNPIINSILLGDPDEIGRVASGLVGGLLARRLDSESVIRRLNDYISKAAQSLSIQTGIDIADVAAVNARADAESLTDGVAAVLRGLAESLSAQMDASNDGNLQKLKREIERYVEAHYPEDIFLPDVAREISYSSAYFSRLFKQCFSCNFIAYLTDVRIKAAKELMKDPEMTIREIGEMVGYKDPNYFTKVFRKVTGVSPSEYRTPEADGGGL